MLKKLRQPAPSAALRQEWNNAGELSILRMPLKFTEKNYDLILGKDVVVLHMFDRFDQAPNPSPYPLKVETFLRMADIKYVTDFKHPMSR